MRWQARETGHLRDDGCWIDATDGRAPDYRSKVYLADNECLGRVWRTRKGWQHDRLGPSFTGGFTTMQRAADHMIEDRLAL